MFLLSDSVAPHALSIHFVTLDLALPLSLLFRYFEVSVFSFFSYSINEIEAQYLYVSANRKKSLDCILFTYILIIFIFFFRFIFLSTASYCNNANYYFIVCRPWWFSFRL